jgi:mannose-1-phosphate guanylyltransferase/mannose-6-phosphate isomerase
MKVIPTILCGGSGTRLWPLSRSKAPKQLQALTNDKSLLANTLLRLKAYERAIDPVILCGLSYVDEIEAQMAEEGVTVSAFITEPKGRDTAAAAAIAAHWGARLQAEDPDEDYIVLLLPADHHIANIPAFHDAIDAAARTALESWIATIGITPDAPETGFGYINRESSRLDGLPSYKVARFVEKPDLETAKSYLESGDFLWNAGMFAFRPSVFLQELQALEPEIADKSETAFNAAKAQKTGEKVSRLDLPRKAFLQIPALSVDYAVMEKTDKASVLPCRVRLE